MRAAIYTRLSLADDQSTYARQLDDCTRLAEAKRWTFDPDHDWYTDYGVSATKGRRAAFETMLGQLERYDIVCAWKLDRLTRSHRDLTRLLETCEQHDVALALVTEGLDASTPMGRFGLEVLTSAASLEAATTGLRVRSAQQHMAANGRHRGGPIPYGWYAGPHKSGVGTWLHLHPDEAPIVREMVDRLMSGESAMTIAHDLNRRKVPTRKGGGWTDSTILGIVRSPRMVGWQPYTPNRRERQSPSHIVRDASGEPVPAGDPQIDLATWMRLVDLLAPSAQSTFRRDAALLSGIAICVLCRGKMHSNGRSYLCTPRRLHGTTVHEVPVTIGRPMVERWVDVAIRTRLARAEMPDPEPVDVKVWGEVENLRAKLDLLDDRWASGELDDRRHARLTAQLQDKLAKVERATVQPASVDVSPEDWDQLEGPPRRKVAGLLLDRVEVQPYREDVRTRPWRARLCWVDGQETVLR